MLVDFTLAKKIVISPGFQLIKFMLARHYWKKIGCSSRSERRRSWWETSVWRFSGHSSAGTAVHFISLPFCSEVLGSLPEVHCDTCNCQLFWFKMAQMLACTSSIPSKPQLNCTQPTNECNLPHMASSFSCGPIFLISLNEQGSERDAQAEMLRSLSSHGGLGRLETQISDSEPWSNSLYGNDPLEVHTSVLGS